MTDKLGIKSGATTYLFTIQHDNEILLEGGHVSIDWCQRRESPPPYRFERWRAIAIGL